AGLRGIEVAHEDAAAAELDPGIDVRRLVAVVAEHFVALAPRNAVGEERESERGRTEQRDFIRTCADEIRAHAARLLHVPEYVAEFLRILRAESGVGADGI